MENAIFNIGAVLFYDRENDIILNLSDEDSETELFFDFKKYTALGVVIKVDNNVVKLLTPNFTKILVNGLSSVKEKELVKKMKQIVTDTGKCFERECGVQPTVELSVMTDADMDDIIENPKVVLMGLETIYYYCKQFLGKDNLAELLEDSNISFLNNEKLFILMGGIGAEISRIEFKKNYEFEQQGYFQERIVDIIRDNMPVDKFISAGDRVGMVEFIEDDELEPEKLVLDIPEEPTVLIKSLENIREEFPKADLLAFYVPAIMSITIEN